MKLYTTLFLFICYQLNLLSQTELNQSHFARSVRLGNAYVGIAEGPETMMYNSAGLTSSKNLSMLYSNGIGYDILNRENVKYSFNDAALVVPVNTEIGTFGAVLISSNYHIGDSIFNYDNGEYRISLQYARKLFENIALGIALDYYSFKITSEELVPIYLKSSDKYSAFDLGIGLLYTKNIGLLEAEDRFNLGLQFSGILNSSLKEEEDYKWFVGQSIRTGFSYLYNPKIFESDLLKFLFSYEIFFEGNDYVFRNYFPAYGFEIVVYNTLHFSYGREVINTLNQSYRSMQYPVHRLGIGADMNFGDVLSLNRDVIFKLDYCYSKHEELDKGFEFKHRPILSIGLELQL
jgi:hypothetical protein